MAAKEQEEEVPTSSHTLLGVIGIHHTSSFCVSKTFQLKLQSFSASVHATFPVDSQGYHGVEVMSLLNSYQLKLQHTFKNFQLFLSSSPV